MITNGLFTKSTLTSAPKLQPHHSHHHSWPPKRKTTPLESWTLRRPNHSHSAALKNSASAARSPPKKTFPKPVCRSHSPYVPPIAWRI
ncbi:hypothetical protein L484_018595 [Morus notabilis]|uniref:Uncharacterized protein n=1 Tax=Morus notabilis TaxID=981085 RepID=W9RHL5_9ROSA|nr:hypothetical protein L484_018595 [Morus notabilis]